MEISIYTYKKEEIKYNLPFLYSKKQITIKKKRRKNNEKDTENKNFGTVIGAVNSVQCVVIPKTLTEMV